MIKSKELALEVIKVCKELKNSKCEGALINQFLRSGILDVYLERLHDVSASVCGQYLRLRSDRTV